MANLAALTAARNAKLSENQYGDGVAYVSVQTHVSAAKGLRIIGFRGDQIRKIPCDNNYRMITSSLEKAILDDQAAGKIPFAVVASAGTTNTGSIDPMNDIANICEKHNLWLHVDGAYGASILVSQKYKYLLDGVCRSDSISWDAHKWLMQTYSCSALLVRNKQYLINGFSANPEYYKDATATDNEINYWEFGPEMTRPARSLKLWITLQALGTEAIGQMVEYGVQLGEWAENEIKKHENWEIISPAQLGIINFRYAPPSFTDEQLDALNTQISNAIVKDGFAFVLTTILDGKTVLRIIAIHPDTTKEDIRNTVQLLAKYALEAGI
jgi:glutamate/tyrosine decarboxylase-like PLP-dependent enzyme